MASLLSGLNPLPRFPDYTGPHKVGTVDVEVPVSELVAPSPTPEGAADLHTVLFRIFYPAIPDAEGKPITWLPAPQRLHIAAYAQFLGAGATLSSILSFLPRHLHWTTIPALKNAALLPPHAANAANARRRWPTMIFSHGLGGNRNAYSYFAGSLASHGVVVVCAEHRDGSAALSLVRDPGNQDSRSITKTRRAVPYVPIPHEQTNEIWEARNRQLRIRLWELGLIFEAVAAIDRGDEAIINSNLNKSTPATALSQLSGRLDVVDPGRVIFAGHSFGAAAVVQLLKSTFYRAEPSLATKAVMPLPLFSPAPASAIARQISPLTPTILLDMWCFPLLSASTAPLYDLPLPCYSTSSPTSPPSAPSAPTSTSTPTSTRLLAIESSAFFSWRQHLHAKARVLSPRPSAAGAVAAELFSSSSSSSSSSASSPVPRPHFFYVERSAHLAQSDFAVLFPRLTGRLFGSDRPGRVLRLNVRAALQFLRECGAEGLAGTARHVVRADQVGGGNGGGGRGVDDGGEEGEGERVERDEDILRGGAEGGNIQGWKAIDIVGLGAEAYPSELEMRKAKAGREGVEEEVVEEKEKKVGRAREVEKEMEGQMEPSSEKAEVDGEERVAALEKGA